MVDNPKAAVMIIFIVSIISFATAAVFGSFNVADDICDQIIPTSITTSEDTIKPITEKNFTPITISIKQPQKKNYTKNYTSNNTTNTTNSSNYSYSNYSESSYKKNYSSSKNNSNRY